ncbi:MAG: WS/DGAT/MGAT family O-acyltransferase [Oceanococcaceae bacterium]
MKTLSAQDASFLYLERSHQPMHVGGLHLYSLPEGVDDAAAIADIMQGWRASTVKPPFNQKLVWPLRKLGRPSWVEDTEVDLEYHLRHSALPAPGRYREMFALVSRLHGTLLHRDRPLWEAHLIEGVETRQFALYTKMHHAMIDGMGGMRLLQKSLSTDPAQRDMPPPWEVGRGPRKPRAEGAPTRGGIQAMAEQMQDTLGALPGAVKGMFAYADAMRRGADNGLVSPFAVPRTALNTRIGAARRFVAQSWKIDRIKTVGKALDATLNDVVLAMSAGALRTWLLEHAELPDVPLSAMAPVALAPKDADDYGNAVTAILCSLATHVADPVDRLHAIQRSMNQGKALLQSMTRAEIMLLTMLGAAPTALPLILGYGHKMPPFNVVISNVPGPRERLYWNGARLDGMYPVSIPVNGVALNITVTSYVDSLDFGLIACRRSVPSAQRLIDYLEQALAELEQAAGIGASERSRKRR